MGVVKLGSNLDFAEEAIGRQGGAEVGVEDLDGDLSVVLEVLGQVDRGHTTAAQLAEDSVFFGKCLSELI